MFYIDMSKIDKRLGKLLLKKYSSSERKYIEHIIVYYRKNIQVFPLDLEVPERGSFLFRYAGVISVGNEACFLPQRVRLSSSI